MRRKDGAVGICSEVRTILPTNHIIPMEGTNETSTRLQLVASRLFRRFIFVQRLQNLSIIQVRKMKKFTIIYFTIASLLLIVPNLAMMYYPLPDIGLPIDPADIDYTENRYGIWPYGVCGAESNQHPEGHPGIDFSFSHPAPIFAVCDLTVSGIYTNDHGQNVVSAQSASDPFVTFEFAMGDLIEGTGVGTSFQTGAIIGNASLIGAEEENFYMIHFGVKRQVHMFLMQTESPSLYFSEGALEALGLSIWDEGSIMNKSTYVERNDFPYLENPTGADFDAYYVWPSYELAIILIVIIGVIYVLLLFKLRKS